MCFVTTAYNNHKKGILEAPESLSVPNLEKLPYAALVLEVGVGQAAAYVSLVQPRTTKLPELHPQQ